MTLDEFRQSLTDPGPPRGLSRPLQALWHSANEDWDAAHDLVQSESGSDGAWVHAHLHRIEGDLPNAEYWYRRTSRPTCEAPLEEEWAEIASALLMASASKMDSG